MSVILSQKKLSYFDFLELPQLPKYLRFKHTSDLSFPIHELPDKDIRLLFKKMAEKTIELKHNPKE